MGCSSSQTAPVWVPSTGCSPSGTGCSSEGPPQDHKPCQQTCSSMGFSLLGFPGPVRSLLQCRLAMGSQLTSGIHLLQHGVSSTCSSMGSSTGYRWISAPLWTSMDCKGTTCLTMVFIIGCKGKISALVSQAPPPLSFFTDLGVCRVVSLTSSHSSLFTAVSLHGFFPLLKYVITEALPLSLIGLALASGGSILEPAGTGFIRHGGSFLQLLTEATSITPCYQNLATQTHNSKCKIFFF